MIAVVVVRAGALPAGADEAVAEAEGRAILIGDGTAAALGELRSGREVQCAEAGTFAPAAWAAALAPHLQGEDVVVLPASADGRDLAPRLSFALGRPLYAGAIAVDRRRVVVVRAAGLVAEEHAVREPIVATLEPGVRGVANLDAVPAVFPLDLTVDAAQRDAEVVEVLPPDPTTMDLGEAPRIIAGGAGLGGAAAFELLHRVADALGVSHGASRVAADLGWVEGDRFIGTTGVTVDPDLYVALGISGAVQHVSGLGDPEHLVAVNIDPSAPIMAMADLAIVTDAPTMLGELAARLGIAP